jgi:uncharacterized protein (TIGR01777 family)
VNVLVSGAGGFIGSALVPVLRASGHRVVALTRRADAGQEAIRWDPAAGRLDAASLEGFDAVVHLAGENIGAARLTAARRRAIADSRVGGTGLLATALAGLRRPPAVLVSASGINVYGTRGDEVLREGSAPGEGFLAGVCRAWEAATTPAAEAGVRVVVPRTAMVLAPDGAALARMLPVFRAGVGGVLGPGTQWWSWISRDDLVAVIERALADEGLAGPVNAASPGAVTNREFTRTLAAVLHRPAVLPAPAFALRLVLGSLADELLLASIRVEPAALLARGFEFADPELAGALRRMLAPEPAS